MVRGADETVPHGMMNMFVIGAQGWQVGQPPRGCMVLLRRGGAAGHVKKDETPNIFRVALAETLNTSNSLLGV